MAISAYKNRFEIIYLKYTLCKWRKVILSILARHKLVYALIHCVSTSLIGYRCQPPTAAPDPQLCSAKLLLCKNGPKRKSWEKTLTFTHKS